MSEKKRKILSVFGTRPEAIKMCPLVKELRKQPGLESLVCVTGQHRQLLDPVLAGFGVAADFDLDILRPGQSLAAISAAVLSGMEKVLEEVKPDLVLVQGDTTSALAAAMAAFYQKIPVGHVEAGLRSGDPASPFPEEMNRRLIGQIASLHFAPTEENRKNLAREGITENVFVTGNTGMDALRTTVRADYAYKAPALRGLESCRGRTLLFTAHRRENLGGAMESIGRAVRRLAADFGDVRIVCPMHPNPRVRQSLQPLLAGQERVILTEPLDTEDMHNLMARSYLVLTDSGGLQEEAPFLGVPVLVLRRETERPEAVAAGAVKVAGVEEAAVYDAAAELLRDEKAHRAMARAVSPYGDGHASERIVGHLLAYRTEA